MPVLQSDGHGRCWRWCAGGIETVGSDRLWEEIAFLAYYLHWPLDDLLDLTHAVRQRMTGLISNFNRSVTGG